MNSDFFVKTTRSDSAQTEPALSGKTKAAILYAELGSGVTSAMTQYFSDKELRTLRKAVQSLGNYTTADALYVLQSVAEFGRNKGFAMLETTAPPQNGASQPDADPAIMADLIRNWLSKE